MNEETLEKKLDILSAKFDAVSAQVDQFENRAQKMGEKLVAAVNLLTQYETKSSMLVSVNHILIETLIQQNVESRDYFAERLETLLLQTENGSLAELTIRSHLELLEASDGDPAHLSTFPKTKQ